MTQASTPVRVPHGDVIEAKIQKSLKNDLGNYINKLTICLSAKITNKFESNKLQHRIS